MKRLVVAVWVLACAASTAWAQGGSEADRLRAAYEQAANANDASALATLYTEDAVRMPPNTPTQKGRMSIEGGFREFFAAVKVSHLVLTPRDEQVTGDTAYTVGTFTMTTQRAGAPPMQTEGRYLTIMKKQADGSWKVKCDMNNSDMPLPMTPAATKSSGAK